MLNGFLYNFTIIYLIHSKKWERLNFSFEIPFLSFPCYLFHSTFLSMQSLPLHIPFHQHHVTYPISSHFSSPPLHVIFLLWCPIFKIVLISQEMTQSSTTTELASFPHSCPTISKHWIQISHRTCECPFAVPRGQQMCERLF